MNAPARIILVLLAVSCAPAPQAPPASPPGLDAAFVSARAQGGTPPRSFALHADLVLAERVDLPPPDAAAAFHVITVHVMELQPLRITCEGVRHVPGIIELANIITADSRLRDDTWEVTLFAQASPAILLIAGAGEPLRPRAMRIEHMPKAVVEEAIAPPLHPVPGDPFEDYGRIERAFAFTGEDPALYAALPPGEDAAVLDAALKRIFGEVRPVPNQASVLWLLRYVAQTTRLEFTDAALGSQVLAQGHAYCNGMALAFVALCRRIGLPARINAMHNLQIMEAHNMAEVFYDGAWHAFDPTYGVYFEAETMPGLGRIVGLRELFTQANTEPLTPTAISSDHRPRMSTLRPMQVTAQLWTGGYDPDTAPRVLPGDALYGDYPLHLGVLYESIFTTAFPVVFSEESTVSYPILADLRRSAEFHAGEPDGRFEDVYEKSDGRWPRFHGVPYLGKTRLGGAMHLFHLRAPGPVRITYHLLGGGDHRRMDALELKDVTVNRIAIGPATWTLDATLHGPETLLLVVNRYYAAYIDAIHIERLGGE